ncbi:MAG: hypothetical protein HOK41_04560 [Nitrospina sp.]|nr:hypothetical protein [Nitrospina sp.]
MTKGKQLAKLAKKRKKNVPHGYKGIAEYHEGAYECNYVSPYSKSAHNENADVMLILQDWASDESLSRPKDPNIVSLGYSPELPTNKNLIALLDTHFGIPLSDTYATNLFPFVKLGNMSSYIPSRDLMEAAINFAIPQIEVVSPKIVICLGLRVFNTISKSLEKPTPKNLVEAIPNHFKYKDTFIWAQSHPGGLGKANRNRGGIDRVSADWAAMASLLHGKAQ